MRIGIQQKSIAAISVLMAILAFSLMSMSLYHGSRAIRAELMMRGNISTKNLAYNATYATLIGDTAAVAALLDGIMAEKEVLYARVIEPNGTVLAQRVCGVSKTGAADSTSTPPMPNVNDVSDNDGCATVSFQTPIVVRNQTGDEPSSDIGLYDVAGTEGGAPTVIAYAQIGMTTHFVEETIGAMRRNMAWITLVIVLLAVLGTSILVRLSIHPINELVGATERVAGGDYDCKVVEGRRDEIGDLASSFNKMTADLKASREALVRKDLLEALVVELKETQQQLIQAGKMAAIGQLAAGVAHEINNPLAGIMGYAQLAGEHMRAKQTAGIPPGEVPKFIAYIDNMERQTLRCKQIVQNLLRFARTSAHEEIAPLDCNEIVGETLSFLAHQMDTRDITVDVRLAEKLPRVLGHPGKMQQIFTNILINAVQAIKGEGRITVTTELADGQVRTHITDTGEGIPSDNMDKIFEPFFTTKEIGKGTGLGLSVTYGLVKDMGGNISVDSTVGVGTTFTVSFPPTSEEATSPNIEIPDTMTQPATSESWVAADNKHE
ncbi:MAG: ATP-binding protein [Candidatus Zixiibacteriota bacterium]